MPKQLRRREGRVSVSNDVSLSATSVAIDELPAAAALADNTANPTTTLVGAMPHWYDGSTWDRALGNATDGLLVNLGANNDVTTELPAAATLADNTANPTVPGVGSFPHWYDGSTWDRAIGNSTDGLTVNLGSNNDVTTELPAAAALADNTANPTITSVGVFPHWYDGSTWDRALGDSTNGLTVNLGTNNDVTVSGNVTVLNFGLEVGLGNITGYTKVNKFGEAPDCDQNVDTDIWDGADGTTSTDVWVAPTTARTHDIKSTDANDDGDPVGTGMRTVRVYGLTSWSSAETSEDVTLNGTSNVATSNSYVIIHRMVGLTFGSGGTNAGIITATAQTDATVTAAIQAGEGQTLMCIYGVPDTQTIHLFGMRADILRSVASTVSDMKLLVKENADQSDSAFITKEKFQFGSDAPLERSYNPLKSFTGPCIIKMQANAAANNSDVTAAFDAYIVDN